MRLRHIHLDPLGGLAGDMFLAAMLDAFPDAADAAFGAMRAAGLPGTWRVDLVAHEDGAFTGRRLAIGAAEGAEQGPDAHFRALERRLAGAPLDPGVRARALDILGLLAGAEAAVHGASLDEVHFHELADWDSIADVVGAAAVIEAGGASSWSAAPLPVGRGRVPSRHGPLPVPAPATARLIEGLAVVDDGIPGERVTPTGAAILRHLRPASGLPGGQWRLAATGTGFGTRTLPGISNALRVLVYEAGEAAWQSERIAVVGFEVDDQTPEDLAIALDALRATEGVLDAAQWPVLGKKGRAGAHVQILARPERLDGVIETCFAETTTIGLRWRIEDRATLPRRSVRVGGDEVKVVTRPGGVTTAKAGAVQGVAGHAARAQRRTGAEARARDAKDDDGT